VSGHALSLAPCHSTATVLMAKPVRKMSIPLAWGSSCDWTPGLLWEIVTGEESPLTTAFPIERRSPRKRQNHDLAHFAFRAHLLPESLSTLTAHGDHGWVQAVLALIRSCRLDVVAYPQVERAVNRRAAVKFHTEILTWSTLIQLLLIIAIAIVLRWLLRKGVNLVVSAMLRTAKKRDEAMGLGRMLPKTSERQTQRTKTVGGLLSNLGVAIILTVAILAGFSTIGVKIGPILASAGIVGVALAFGAQSLVKDFLSGLFIIIEDQYGVGDTVNIDELGGVVEEVGLRTTRIRDFNGVAWYLRNGEILKVGNISQGWATSFTDISVHADEDPDEVTRVLNMVLDELAEAYPDSILEQPKVLGVGDITGGTMTFQVWTKCVAGTQFEVIRVMRQMAKTAFAEARIRGAF